MDNSGGGPLKAPGFGGIPIHHQLKPSEAFTHGAGGTDVYDGGRYGKAGSHASWESCPRATAREISMIGLMNSITDKKDWNTGILDADVVSGWWTEASRINLISERAWKWCISELKDKAELLNSSEKEHLVVLDIGSRVCKSDTVVAGQLREELVKNSRALRQAFDADPTHLERDLISPSLYPLVLGKTAVMLEGGQVGLDNLMNFCGDGSISPSQPPHPQRVDPRESPTARAEFPFGYRDIEAHMYRFSTTYQWLPCEVEIQNSNSSEIKVGITSYINNLHPTRYQGLYHTLENLISLSIKPWNDCLIYAQRPRGPLRIRTYGIGPKNCEHPEPGTSYTYEEWIQGNTAKAIIPESPRLLSWCPELGQNHVFYNVALEETFRSQGLQVVIQLSDIELPPDRPFHPGRPWHISGLLDDHIVATSMYVYDAENISGSSVSFRQMTAFDDVEYFWDYEDLPLVAAVFGVDVPILEDGLVPLWDSVAQATQVLGSVQTPQGRLLTWPNAIEHQLEPIQLADVTRKGHQHSVILHLVDPHYRLCSTRNVPPQRHDWWAEEIIAIFQKIGLSPEVTLIILDYTHQWPMGAEEANEITKKMAEEQRWATEALRRDEFEYWGMGFTGRLPCWRVSAERVAY